MRTLLVVDLQNDFMPFGALPVRDGDAVVPVANLLMPAFDLVVASQDWHPADHGSFASAHPGSRVGEFVALGGVQQILWPDHCAQNLPGASFHSGLNVAEIDFVVRKGTDPSIDSYSAFFDNGHRKDTGLAEYLREHSVRDITIMGLATDYCVKYSVLDALDLGFAVTVIADGCRAVEVSPGDGERAIEEMRAHGARIAASGDLLR
ncbi:MAG: bifunctional nicotinamidase/pyrazinamidase [Coriobacteriia bacterium]